MVPLAAGVVAGCAGARVPAGPGGPDAVCVVDAPLAGGVAGHSGDGSGGALASGGQSGREQGGRALRVEPAGGAGRGVAPIVVGLPGPADAGNAPVARTDAERLVYAQLYAPLVRLTCLGQVRGELAARWWAEEEGRRWDFELRRDAIYEGGDVATAADVARSWLRARPASVGGRGRAGVLPVAGLVELGPHALRVDLTEPVAVDRFVEALVAVRDSVVEGWPVGPGAYRVASVGGSGGRARSIALEPKAGGWPIELRVVPGDGRNALDEGVDLLVTEDRTVIDYALSTGRFVAAPLPWTRAYFLLVPAGARVAGDDPGSPGGPVRAAPPATLAALARDVVGENARPVDVRTGACGPDLSVAASVVGSTVRGPDPIRKAPRIVYPADDAAARALAERLVALAVSPARPDGEWLREVVPGLVVAGGRIEAVALAGEAFGRALAGGEDVAYVVPVERNAATDPCDLVRAVIHGAPWLGAGASGMAGVVVPLVETRRTLLLRRGIRGVEVDGHGTPLLHRAWREAAAPTP